ncbi:hypothetical protein OE88DRAFT_1731243 [Heliocybe sulcata]|uniref:CASTOR ACT domain-containing protein n=1 Tax=Heliocybe sulcata TaxID=5364 RepID=A0A5C3NHL6_9AGAM|nr:hypothetical protein OE88DRAFT_1731243 [Heliocybe sulcata]
MSPNDPMQVTISLLPVQLALVHIPRSRLPDYTHPVLRQLLKPSPVFLNITCNDIELSLFGDWDMSVEFSSVRRRSRKERVQEDIEVSEEPWSVLQIDSHSDSVDNSGARIAELSRPLASAGISILYQSSYTSDFILVRSSRIKAVMHILSGSGFDLYTEDADQLISGMSPIVSPTACENGEDVDELLENRPVGDLIRCGSGAVLTRTRSSTDSSLRSMPSIVRDRHPSSSRSISPASSFSPLSPVSPLPTPVPTRPSLSSRTSSHSPSATDVEILEPDLTCVGLAEDASETWTLKMVKLVAYPELIPGVVPRKLRPSPSPHVGEDARRALRLSALAPQTSESVSPTSSPTDSSSSEDEDEDGSYFRSRNRNHSVSESSLASSMSPCTEDDDEEVASPVEMAEDEKLKGEVVEIETAPDPTATPHVAVPPLPSVSPSSRRNLAISPSTSAIPFFSFTRTQESSSLTTDAGVLAKLFPANERHMVICSGELDVADQPHAPATGEDGDEEEGAEDESAEASSLMKCLQIDLRKYGLEKHGLVNRFSRVLEENGVNHMYSSTFMSANLLVDKRSAKRAQLLLRTS